MRYMLDTDACIALIKRKPASVLRRLSVLVPGDAGISAVTSAELRYGVMKSSAIDRNTAALDDFLLPLEIADFGASAAGSYGRVRAGLEKAGTGIGPLDAQIGAHALSLGAILVTNNVREFRRIPGLKIENWIG